MAESKKKDSKKIIDVSHPDKTAPSGNSKSVIVTNRPIMKDPMVVDEAEGSEENSTEKLTAKTEAVISPPGDSNDQKDESKSKSSKSKKSDTKDEPELKAEDGKKTIAVLAEEAAVKKEEKEADAKDEQSDELPGPEIEDKPEIKPPEPEEDEPAEAKVPEPETEKTDDPAEDEKPEDNTDGGQSKNDRTVTEADAEEAAKAEKHDAAIKKLVDSKQFFLPINAVEKRRSKRVMALGIILSILLVLLWIDIALDASLIEIDGIKPVTHFFSN